MGTAEPLLGLNRRDGLRSPFNRETGAWPTVLRKSEYGRGPPAHLPRPSRNGGRAAIPISPHPPCQTVRKKNPRSWGTGGLWKKVRLSPFRQPFYRHSRQGRLRRKAPGLTGGGLWPTCSQCKGAYLPSASVNVGISIGDLLAKWREEERLAAESAPPPHETPLLECDQTPAVVGRSGIVIGPPPLAAVDRRLPPAPLPAPPAAANGADNGRPAADPSADVMDNPRLRRYTASASDYLERFHP